MLTEILKEETRTPHQQLEKLLMLRLKNMSTTEEYASVLADFYGFMHPLEKKIDAFIGTDILPDYEERRKSDALAEDMRTFGISGGEKGTVPEAELPKIRNAGEAMGALYVLEGSTLGGKILTEMISKKLKMDTGKGFSFFSSYGDRVIEMWKRFQQTLNALYTAPEERRAVVAAANHTFSGFHQWLKK
ncbi:MAG: biliverdin-producing heme oxygenase [Mucilaginibacter polytrichastri]|nr:biliverdin-producing heme oxygenase [Mucilaginibacter polytrichastri]